MKKYLKLALIGAAAGICLSAQTAPSAQTQDEVAMAQCSKNSNGSVQRQRSCNTNDDSNQNQSCTSSTCKPNNKNQKKSAAQKVVQGS